MLKAGLAGVLVLILAGCATKWEAPATPKFGQKSFELVCDKERYMLYVSDELNFVLLDAFLTPVVSKKLENGAFQNTKFLPPNAKFDEIFIGILNMIKNEEKISLIKAKKLTCKAKEL
ncbi:hypothetical protein CIG1485E_1675 [Campylobacter iguaniorum]|uniref:Lipoprotein n=1 Tax=Campylobacter iguaniorum TaxID=1244531 RepID=A0A076FI30_9BACT|nr:hypothetical protein [Campylobacter iguaniorum]AII15484.1 hypothetical protein CIG1485E_1675 [Campylobacter iguaniorum]